MIRNMGSEVESAVHVFGCAECPRVSSAFATGWKAYRVDDPQDDGPPGLGFYCPDCARREFGLAEGAAPV
jgi:hypothetical protein